MVWTREARGRCRSVEIGQLRAFQLTRRVLRGRETACRTVRLDVVDWQRL